MSIFTSCMHPGSCVRACIHACIHTHIHTHDTDIHIYRPEYMHTCIHASIHPSIYPSIHPSIHPSMHTYIRTYIQTYKSYHILYFILQNAQYTIHNTQDTYILHTPTHTHICTASPSAQTFDPFAVAPGAGLRSRGQAAASPVPCACPASRFGYVGPGFSSADQGASTCCFLEWFLQCRWW